MNLSHFGKQAWRLMLNLEALQAKLLKVFPSDGLGVAKGGQNVWIGVVYIKFN